MNMNCQWTTVHSIMYLFEVGVNGQQQVFNMNLLVIRSQ